MFVGNVAQKFDVRTCAGDAGFQFFDLRTSADNFQAEILIFFLELADGFEQHVNAFCGDQAALKTEARDGSASVWSGRSRDAVMHGGHSVELQKRAKPFGGQNIYVGAIAEPTAKAG